MVCRSISLVFSENDTHGYKVSSKQVSLLPLPLHKPRAMEANHHIIGSSSSETGFGVCVCQGGGGGEGAFISYILIAGQKC